MVAGQFSLLGSQLLLMMAPMFWVMCIGRFLEGIASAVIMTAGLALICDTTPDKDIGGQLGMAMIGMPFGALVGPPVGGALYKRWGYKAPFIFSILFTVVDITCRLLVIEKPVSDRSLGRHSLPKEPKRTEAVGLQPVQPSAGLFNEAKEPSTTVQVVATAPVLPVREDTAANKLPVIDILVQFASSPRLLTSLVVVFVCSFVFSAADVTIPLCLQNVWGFDSRRVGLAYLAAIIPTLISNPLAGVLADRFGPQWIAILFTICGTPWWGAMTTTFSLPFFIFSYGIENFFVAAVAPPMTAELAAITRTMKGVGYAHTYGTFNIVMGTANAVGSIVAGQVYGHSNRGWDILCYIHIGLLGLALIAMMTFTGEKPFLRGGSWKLGKHASIDAAMENSAEGDQNGPTA
ncbi:major facilitator superfamily domain-containing protein [Rhodofomes roseus]|uniref:Major facilitator superfamily domain-containing protein n=1 Tax=Rhodofomes roseus TaxID=34475 RepID=A0ABQ8KL42_9APHY|nr:major facilitator superfamily domain-containing protein [Rhodofomes roseus]KAH9839037.1 major facilitator superfamily domain-containing protein [Rhodofomes roseus]